MGLIEDMALFKYINLRYLWISGAFLKEHGSNTRHGPKNQKGTDMIQDMASFRKNHGGIRRHGIFFVKVLGITRDMGSFRHVSSIWQVRVHQLSKRDLSIIQVRQTFH